MRNVVVQIRAYSLAFDQYFTHEETWTLTDKLGRCSAPIVRSPEGLETEVYPQSGKLHTSPKLAAKYDF